MKYKVVKTSENRKLFEGSGEIILPNGDVAVTATGKYMKMPVEKITDGELTSDEWKYVEDEEKVEYIEL